MALSEKKSEIKKFEDRLDQLRRSLEVVRKNARLEEIQTMEAMPGFWDDNDNATKIQKEKNILQEVVGTYNGLKELYEEFGVLVEFAEDGEDEDSANEALEVFESFLNNFNKAEQKVLLSEEVDPNNAIVQINAGAGGTESCDWASMLQRMIIRWSESKGFKIQLLDEQAGDSAGIKSCTMMIEGNYAYGFLKSESGVHRLVRISPFDSGGRRHTSFSSMFVSPEVDDNIEIEILDKDLKIDVYRSGGAGGQSVNTTDSAVRITHLPSGIVVTCQNERSQLQNKQQAMKVLRSRLYDLEMEKRREKENEQEAQKKDIAWGAQIRSYVLHPYKMVKDHRTNCESSQAEKVLDGDLDSFMDAYLRWSVGEVQEGETN
ncbi:peptide chain release factor 2 [Halobacteriovorax sp. GB3]|uniref:peptide chain release factor 2 n=1 Tax=Halobacteriovorax sp. GB3 TaxID=2719615 RepID=UPI00235EF5C4|nr:peptide chain release factor 2 [Halobacteriovorax sp. GB3]MDD0854102.1 peptide chain release factor 2 [Halobacteriovorax sp. GB3]